ncbi:hypothetical protein GQ55_1G019500 [Panicum hallii var. hallii]|uniref:Uncharacterized protein n=2 Tax=Panicum hallii TaxID=206008 RepID=A0A2T7F188_9POAL|nr:hypothetical protein GQ55_1G019500 [Panicum hallii var. hallii]
MTSPQLDLQRLLRAAHQYIIFVFGMRLVLLESCDSPTLYLDQRFCGIWS